MCVSSASTAKILREHNKPVVKAVSSNLFQEGGVLPSLFFLSFPLPSFPFPPISPASKWPLKSKGFGGDVSSLSDARENDIGSY